MAFALDGPVGMPSEPSSTAINFGRNTRSNLILRNASIASTIEALLAKMQASPLIRRQLKAWLKAGILEDDHLSPTTAGTPQGGSCSPLLALIALHGMDEAITQVYPQARVIAYADDGVVLHEDRQVLEHCQELLKTWLAKMGLTLNEAKSRITPHLGRRSTRDWSFWASTSGSIGWGNTNRANVPVANAWDSKP